MISERVVRFGNAASLVGIVSEAEDVGDAPRPGFIVLNSGVLHRVGPARLHVVLARKLAAAGFTSLRFDLSGIGDSEPRKDALPFDDRVVLEVQEAMDYMSRTRGIQKFVLFGLCSGADAAFLVAKADRRVVGHVSIDGFAYRTFGYYVHYYGPRLLKPRSWAAFASRRIRGLARLAGRLTGRGPSGRAPRSHFVRRFPPRDHTAADLAALAAREVRQFFIYSAGHERFYNHAGQFDTMFRDVYFNGGLTVRYFSNADHTFPDLREQDALTTAVREWATLSWPATAALDGPELPAATEEPAAVVPALEGRGG